MNKTRTPRDTSGRTTPVQHETEVPRLPHEHDESADSQRTDARQQDLPARKAYGDAEKKQPDTGTAPVMNEVYDRQKRPKTVPR